MIRFLILLTLVIAVAVGADLIIRRRRPMPFIEVEVDLGEFDPNALARYVANNEELWKLCLIAREKAELPRTEKALREWVELNTPKPKTDGVTP